MQRTTRLQKPILNDTRRGAVASNRFASRHVRGLLFCTLFCVLTVSVLFAGYRTRRTQGARLIHRKNSLYHQILVYEYGSIVTLQFGRPRAALSQSEVDLSDLRRHRLEYTQIAFCGLLYNPEPERVLVVGLGGGVIPREMHHYLPDAEIDVAEIDPEVPKTAEEYFGFRQDEKLQVHVVDGRMFVRKLLREGVESKYDIIILDAFNSDYIPFHLMTREFLEEVQGILADDGVVVANVFFGNRLFDAELKTFLAVYGRCQAFFGTRSGNVLLVALGQDAELLSMQTAAERAAKLQSDHKFAFDLRRVAERLTPDTRPDAKARVLTDDRAPVNWLRTQKRRR